MHRGACRHIEQAATDRVTHRETQRDTEALGRVVVGDLVELRTVAHHFVNLGETVAHREAVDPRIPTLYSCGLYSHREAVDLHTARAHTRTSTEA